MAKTLMQLPPELMCHIFGYLGTSFFHQDFGRLAICRYWYSLARQVLLRHLRFSIGTLLDFHRATEGDSERAEIVRHIISVDLVVHLGRYWQRPETREVMGRAWELSPATLTPAEQSEARQAWDAEVNSALSRLGATLSQANRLESLSMHAHPDHWLRSRPEQYMPAEISSRALSSLLSLENLRHLELDLTSCYISQTDLTPETHYCAVIGTLLLTLESFSCRISRFCEALMDPPASDSPLRLSRFTVYAGSFDDIKIFVPRRCQHVSGERRSALPGKMQAQARALVQRMKDPRQACVVTSGRRNMFLRAYDAIEDRHWRVVSCEPLGGRAAEWPGWNPTTNGSPVIDV
jgi:hypothetical protein